MAIEFLYYEHCPSHEVAFERLQKVMEDVGVQQEIRIIKVETEEDAVALCFVGSPTIRVDGHDIIEIPSGESYRLACRIYHLEDGRISPLPSEAMINDGLRRAISMSSHKAEEE